MLQSGCWDVGMAHTKHAEHEGVSTGRLPGGSDGVPELRHDGGEKGDPQ